MPLATKLLLRISSCLLITTFLYNIHHIVLKEVRRLCLKTFFITGVILRSSFDQAMVLLLLKCSAKYTDLAIVPIEILSSKEESRKPSHSAEQFLKMAIAFWHDDGC